MKEERRRNTFAELKKIDVSRYVEKNGQFNYLSWARAWAELKKRCPDASWGVVKAEDGSPFMQTACGYFVQTWVDVEGCKVSHVHPVLDNRNQPIENPNAFHINTAIMRCMTKNVAMHGPGLYVYAGEDLPEPDMLKPKEIDNILDLAKGLEKKFVDDLSKNIDNGRINSNNYEKAINRVLELNKGDKDGGSK